MAEEEIVVSQDDEETVAALEWELEGGLSDADKTLLRYWFARHRTRALSAARPLIEAAWRDGWQECKARLTDDESFCLTDDVEEDAWDDSKTAAAIRSGSVGR